MKHAQAAQEHETAGDAGEGNLSILKRAGKFVLTEGQSHVPNLPSL